MNTGQGIKLIIPAESHNSHSFQIVPIQSILRKVPNKKHGGRLMMMVGAEEPVKWTDGMWIIGKY